MPVTTCHLCTSSNLALVLDLGLHPLADTFLKKEQLARVEEKFPLQVLLCRQCGHAMNSYIVPPEKRYQENEYSYDSSNSKVSITHFDEMAKEVIEKGHIGKDDLVVDIGGNVGTLLEAFRNQCGSRILNIEPSGNIAVIAEKNNVPTVQDFWNDAAADKVVEMGKAKAITITNAFNHIGELDPFMRNIERALSSDGVFVIEAPYLLTLVEQLAFDTIYLEHISYFAVKPLVPYFKKFNLSIMDVVHNDYMGGSIRLTVGRGAESPKVAEYIAREEEAGIFNTAVYERMTKKMEEFKQNLLHDLATTKDKGGKIIGIGAATKGNTLLNYCGIDTALLDFITDASPLKVNKFAPGSRIPILPDEAITSDVTHALILPWNIAEFLKGKLGPKYPSLAFITPHMEQ